MSRRHATLTVEEVRAARSEADLQREILAYLTARGVFHWRASAGIRGRKGTASHAYPVGTADILACHRGRFVGIEVKRPDGTNGQTPAQKAWQAALEASGGLYVLATSLDDVAAALDSIRPENAP